MPRRDPIRLLGRTGGYTHDPANALRSGAEVEPEAVAREVQQAFTIRAHRDAAQARQVQRAMLNGNRLDARIRRALGEAKAQRLDVHREVRLLRLTITAGRNEAAVARRVEVLERRVWPDLPDA